jgi:putative addiction module killer protein
MATPRTSRVSAAGSTRIRSTSAPGYRVYFGMEGTELVILVGGGTKKRQSRDIEEAKERWADYKKRKQLERKGRS